MLVLKRHRDESVTIGPDVQVVVLVISDDWVKLGITAPSTWDVDRMPQAGQPQHITARLVEDDILL